MRERERGHKKTGRKKENAPGVWHWSPVHSVAEQSHVQSAFWTPPFWHAMLHWHVPARSHCPKPGAQLLLSHSTEQVGP